MAKVRGWIYVITNKAMPQVVKVGFSTKDPELRARELDSTGVPHPYVVAYDVLVHGPRDAEKRVHERLSHVRDGKEWFKCSVDAAIAAIREELQGGALYESQMTEPDAPSDAAAQSGPDRRPEKGPTAPAEPRLSKQAPHRLRTTATYFGKCTKCNEQFSVTLTRSDTVARCPSCFAAVDIAEFLRSEFIL
jgi:T5orf172 domain